MPLSNKSNNNNGTGSNSKLEVIEGEDALMGKRKYLWPVEIDGEPEE